MNKFILSALAGATLALGSCSKTPQVTITLDGFTNDTVVVAHATVDGYMHAQGEDDPRIQWDTLTAQNNQITLTPADSTSFYFIMPRQTPEGIVQTLVQPDDHLDINLKLSEGKLTHTLAGTPIAEAINDYNDLTSDLEAQFEKYFTPETLTEEIYDSLMTIKSDKILEWAKKHAGNPAIVLYINQMNPETLLENYELVSKGLEGSDVEPMLTSTRANAEKYATTKKARENIKEGAEAPDFTLQDKDGKPFTFSSLRGKWAVLDFWGTWCGWCVKGIPDMKEAQAKIADKCEFVSIDCGDTQEKWLEALEKHQMPWTQVIVPDDCPTNQNPSVTYAVQGFPTKIIVTPEGKIAKIVVGESPEFYEALKELVK